MSEKPKTATELASMGGKAAAAKMTSVQRSDRAKQAAAARWGAALPRVAFGSDDRPLRIGGLEIPCYVLDDGRRVIAQRGFQTGLGMNASGGARRLLDFLGQMASKGFDCKGLEVRVNEPIRFITSAGGEVGTIAHGYEASALADMCDVILAARKGGHLLKRQEHYADACEILLRGFARVGIISLVDEATGYQDHRARDALAKILEAFIAKELQKWVKTFPLEYFKEMCRLRGVKFASDLKLPRYFGHLTNDLVYARLAPGVLEELKRKNPADGDKGQRKTKHFQWLTADHGHPRLRIHLEGLVVAMKLSKDWTEFYTRLNDLYPKMNETPTIPGMRYDDFESEDATLPASSSTSPPPPSEQSPPAAQE